MYTPSPDQIKKMDNDFTYHPLRPNQPERYERLRAAAKKLAMLLVTNCPPSWELSLAMTKLEESVFWANAAIARNEKE